MAQDRGELLTPALGTKVRAASPEGRAAWLADWQGIDLFVCGVRLNLNGDTEYSLSETWPPKNNGGITDWWREDDIIVRRPTPPAQGDGDLRALLEEARDLLMERRHGNPARSAGHNARLAIEAALAALPRTGEPVACQLCGGKIEGWVCQTCESDFDEVDGQILLKRQAVPEQDGWREQERITTAAIKSDGVIVTVERPLRHGSCINFLNAHGLEYREGQGFLTSTGRFVDRQEAGLIAKAAGQGEPRDVCNGNLFSEDLWDEPTHPEQEAV